MAEHNVWAFSIPSQLYQLEVLRLQQKVQVRQLNPESVNVLKALDAMCLSLVFA